MKKHLFFAFAAAAVLASCSSHDDFDNYSAGTPQAPVDDNSPQEILLGVGAQANVATRGTGTVGGDHNDIATNQWQNQRINVYMFKKDTAKVLTRFFELATETEGGSDYIYNNALFMTPNGVTSGAARHIDDLTATTGDYKRSYYPMNGNFDFWAYRLDGKHTTTYSYKTFDSESAADEGYVAYTEYGKNVYSEQAIAEEVNVADVKWVAASSKPGENYQQVFVKTTTTEQSIGTPQHNPGTFAEANITIPFTIDGSQDVMAASTELTEEDSVNLNGGAPLSGTNYYRNATTFKNYARSLYSAKTARKGVQPNLKFSHLLTRFTFDAIQMKDSSNRGVDYEAVRIKEIKVKSKINGKIVAKYRYLNDGKDANATDSVPQGLDYVIGYEMIKPDNTEEYLQLKKRTDVDQNAPLVALTDGPRQFDYYVKAANTVAKSSGGKYEVGEKATRTDINEGNYTLGRDYDTIAVHGIELDTLNYKAIGEALLVMPDTTEYVMDITVEQTVYGREDANGAGVATSKTVKTQTIKGLKIKAKDVMSASHPNNGSSEETSAGLETFAAGKSYNVRVQVYGLTKIEVKTTLEPWKDGGHIDLDPDDQF